MSSENEIELLEKEVDSYFSSLAIRHYPRNLAAWAVLTKGAIEVQRAAEIEYGGARHRHATINFSRIAALLLNEIDIKGSQRFATRRSFQWSPTFDAVTHRALTEADGYFHAWANFSFWREKRFKAEVIGRLVRFTSEESSRERQVKAFQKTILRKEDRKPPSETLAPMPPYRVELFEKFMDFVGGARSRTVTYERPTELYSEMFPWFQSQSELLVRHREEVCLGRYSMKQIKEFVAALQTMCAVHDHLCFLAARRRRHFPVNSAVLVKKRDEWVAAMPDVHWGMGATIGSVIPTRGAIIPAAVGVDIGCGMMAVQTSLHANHLPDNLHGIRTAIEKAVPHGRTDNGRANDRGAWSDAPSHHAEVWAKMERAYKAVVDKYPKLDHKQRVNHLGTLGTGNHFIEVCLDENENVWFLLHSGSRGVGNRFGNFSSNWRRTICASG